VTKFHKALILSSTEETQQSIKDTSQAHLQSFYGVGVSATAAQAAEHVPNAALHATMVAVAVAPSVAPQVYPAAA
jgi:hypothetical protein